MITKDEYGSCKTVVALLWCSMFNMSDINEFEGIVQQIVCAPHYKG